MNDQNILYAIYDLKPHQYVKGFEMAKRIEKQSIKDIALSFLRQLRLLDNSSFGEYCYNHYESGWS